MNTEYMVKAVVQIAFLTFCFYKFSVTVRLSKAKKLLYIAMTYILLLVLSMVFKLTVVQSLMKYIVLPAVVFVFLLYQPDLRSAFTASDAKRLSLFDKGVMTTSESIRAIVSACETLTEKRRGALVVFPRKVSLKGIIDSGTVVDSKISSSIVGTVFDHDTPLHDGAMIVDDNRIVACACYLPLSKQTDIMATFGTRHRAALGMAEESDAVVLVVSEETGAMSLAYNGSLYYNLAADTIVDTIIALLGDANAQSEMEG